MSENRPQVPRWRLHCVVFGHRFELARVFRDGLPLRSWLRNVPEHFRWTCRRCGVSRPCSLRLPDRGGVPGGA
jgi:hypothetical protein